MTTLLISRTHPHSLNFTSYTHKHHLNLPEVSSIALQMTDQISFPAPVPASTNNRDDNDDNQPNSPLLNFVNELFEFVPGYISVPGVSSPRARIFNPFNLRLNQYGLGLSNFFCRFPGFYVPPATHKVLKAGSYVGRSALGAALLANEPSMLGLDGTKLEQVTIVAGHESCWV